MLQGGHSTSCATVPSATMSPQTPSPRLLRPRSPGLALLALSFLAQSRVHRRRRSLMSQPVGIALVGMGWWGKKMLNVLGAAPADIRVVRAVEPNLETVRALCAEKGVALSADYADALADPAVEAVVLATPHALHGEQIEAAVAAGKHVFCEKPLALTKAGAERGRPPVSGRGPRSRDGARAAVGAADRRPSGQGGCRGTGSHPPDRGQLQPRQVSGARPGQLAPEGRPGPGRRHDRDRHPSARPVGAPPRPGRERAGASANSSRPTCRRATPSRAYVKFRGGGTSYVSASLANPFMSRFAVFGSQRLDRHPRQGARRSARRLDRHLRNGGRSDRRPPRSAPPSRSRTTSSPSRAPCAAASLTRSPRDHLVNNIALLEAVFASARSGKIETVA